MTRSVSIAPHVDGAWVSARGPADWPRATCPRLRKLWSTAGRRWHPIPLAGRLGDHEELDRVSRVVARLMGDTRPNLQSLPGDESIGRAGALHRQLPPENVEELASSPMMMARLARAWRHALLDDAEVR